MLLSIITRTFNGRPAGMRRLVKSLAAQTSQDFEHILLVDDKRRGVEWANANIKRVTPDVHGDYVMILDDDDYLIDSDFVRLLSAQVEGSPEVVVIKMDMGNGLFLPADADWGRRPIHSRIAVSSHVTRRDVFIEHAPDFGLKYDGDFDYIDAVWKCGHEFKWWNRVVSKVGEVSHGKSE